MLGAADYAVEGGYVALVGGAAGGGEPEPDPLAGVAHGAALFDVSGVGQRGQVLAERGLADVEHGQPAAPASITAAAGPYRTIRSRCGIARLTHPPQTPRARLAACATVTSAAAIGTEAAIAH
jgi:hypothetical protein